MTMLAEVKVSTVSNPSNWAMSVARTSLQLKESMRPISLEAESRSSTGHRARQEQQGRSSRKLHVSHGIIRSVTSSLPEILRYERLAPSIDALICSGLRTKVYRE